jgi:hypothetical protein
VPETSERHVYFNGFNRQFGEWENLKVDYEGYRFRWRIRLKIVIWKTRNDLGGYKLKIT